MKKRLGVATALVAALALTALIGMYATAGGGKTELKADQLTSYQESAPAAISSQATGTFEVSIDDEAQTLSYTLTYSGLSAPATVAHIHFGKRAVNGGVTVFLCGTAVSPGPAGTPTWGQAP